jgi:nucleoside-diphosphate-sugar epimerase
MPDELVLVTGGAGFIGSHLISLLVDEGYLIRVIDNFSSGREENLENIKDKIEIIKGDICDAALVKKHAKDADYIIHLAAQTSVQHSIKHPDISFKNNLQGSLNILEAARNSKKVKKFVFASSAAIYGDNQNLPLEEDDLSSPVLSPYALEKLTIENYLKLYHSLYGLNYAALRFFNVYGPRQNPNSEYSGVISKFVKQISAGQNLHIFGDGTQSRDFIYVSDIARACLDAMSAKNPQICNIATGESVSLLELIRLLDVTLGKTVTTKFEDARKGDIKHSLANINHAHQKLRFKTKINIAQGLKLLLDSDAK